MALTNSNTKSGNWQTVTRHDPCPICGKPDWCSRSVDGKAIACRRVDTGEGIHKLDKNGNDFWLYSSNGQAFKGVELGIELPTNLEAERAEPDILHKVYTALLNDLFLSQEHKDNLRKRGLTDEEIGWRGYKTLPEHSRKKIAKKIVQKFGADICAKVPGFFIKQGDNGKDWTLAGAAGLLIPVRDGQKRIIALKTRVDDPGDGPKYIYLTSAKRMGAVSNGPGPGNPIHFPLFQGNLKSGPVRIRITEGELKADIATALSGVLTISLPGVSSWRPVLPAVRELEAEAILLAFDEDAKTNPNVAKAQRLTAQALENEGFAVQVETWPIEYKGIDDALAAGAEIKVLNAVEAWEKIEADEYEAKKAAAEKALQELEKNINGKSLNEAYNKTAILDPVQRDIFIKRIHGILKADGVKVKTVEKAVMERAAKLKVNSKEASSERPDCPYFIKDNRIYMKQMTKDGPVSVPLANFSATIKEEVIRDDGAEAQVNFIINGVLGSGEPLSKVIVSASKFAAMNWVIENWGTRAIVYPGQNKKDHLRCAMQELAENVKCETVYLHTGWRRINNQWIFLHDTGGVGKDGPVENIHVEQHTGLEQVLLPPPSCGSEREQVINIALSFLEVAPGRITYPLFAAIFRAVLAEACAIDYSIFLAGFTGTQKTALAAVAQAFWGAEFMASNLPANWTSTGNALEKLAFLAKDILLTVDDFCPQGTGIEIAKLHKEADRLLRGAGNQAGRGRMRPDGSLRPAYRPRGLILSTGEDIPRGQSLRARIFTLEIEPGDVDLNKLTLLQQAAQQGILVQAMAAYISYIAGRMDELKKELPEKQRVIREKARQKGLYKNTHDRIPEIYSSLFMGFYYFVVFAYEAGAITQERMKELLSQADQYLTEAALRQAELLAGEEPVSRFLQLISAAISSGQAYVADAVDGSKPFDAENWGWRGDEPQGSLIGWTSGELLYLQPDAAFMIAQRMASVQGAALAIGQKTLWKRMAEKKVLAETNPGRNTVKKTITGTRKNVICITSSYILQESGQSGQSGQTLDESPDYEDPY